MIKDNIEFGYELMGPVVHYYLAQLDIHMDYLSKYHNAKFLFTLRAGARIKRLFDIYKPDHSLDWDYFSGSRIMVCKGIYHTNPQLAISEILKNFNHASLREVIKSIFKSEAEVLQLKQEIFDQPAHSLSNFLDSGHQIASKTKNYLKIQSKLFDQYLKSIITGTETPVIIDSGWQGTTQRILSLNYPELNWKGLYFGQYFLPETERYSVSDMTGLIFQVGQYHPNKPHTCFIFHRHLIETLFETNLPSIEKLGKNSNGLPYVPNLEKHLDESEVDQEKDPIYIGVKTYLEDVCNKSKINQIYSQYRSAVKEIDRIITLPTKQDVQRVYTKPRSADFGKELVVDVLLRPESRFEGDTAERRIKTALWTQGQIALEYLQKIAVKQQCVLAGIDESALNRETNGVTRQQYTNIRQLVSTFYENELTGRVAIITRTKDRSLMLKRAVNSIASQTYNNFIWVIVNDGGDVEEVDKIVECAPIDRRKILLIHNINNLGMEAASNIGIRNSNSEYVIIHDDDDTWHPYFLERTVWYLNSSAGKKYGGCITDSVYVSEDIVGDTIVKLGEYPYNDWVMNIQLIEILNKNLFAPIAFLYRRELYDKIGGYNESLPVLGDWEFNIHFLMEADIGVLKEPLAYYHHRDKDRNKEPAEFDDYSNSVIGGRSHHIEYHAILRNSLVRRYPQLLGMLSCLGEMSHSIQQKLAKISYKADNSKADLEHNKVITALVKIIDDRWMALHALYARLNKISKQSQQMSIANLLGEANNIPIATPPDFDEKTYLQNNPAVAVAVAQKKYYSAYHHFIVEGRHRGKQRPTTL